MITIQLCHCNKNAACRLHNKSLFMDTDIWISCFSHVTKYYFVKTFTPSKVWKPFLAHRPCKPCRARPLLKGVLGKWLCFVGKGSADWISRPPSAPGKQVTMQTGCCHLQSGYCCVRALLGAHLQGASCPLHCLCCHWCWGTHWSHVDRALKSCGFNTGVPWL